MAGTIVVVMAGCQMKAHLNLSLASSSSQVTQPCSIEIAVTTWHEMLGLCPTHRAQYPQQNGWGWGNDLPDLYLPLLREEETRGAGRE